MSYKKNASSNRDALFGPAAATGRGGTAAAANKKSSSSTTSSSSSPSFLPPPPTVTNKNSSSSGYSGKSRGADATAARKNLLSDEAKAAKYKEADDYKAKAKAAMNTGFLKRPDPLMASTYYKRAAECYRAAGDAELERYFRLSSAQCNVQIGAWASAAADYTTAAELVMQKEALSEQDCIDASAYHQQAGEAWRSQGETAKAAQSQVASALCRNASSQGTLLSQASLRIMEEAVEAHVPDVMNPFARYRQTGHSAFVDPNSADDETVENPSSQTLAMAKEHLVSRSYAHEPLQQLVSMLTGFGEYASALYAAGAVSTLLSRDGVSTLSLSRAFVVETILQLAMGDPVAAEQTFLQRHCNSRSYLSSREAQLAEELTQAIKRRDAEALEQVRSPSGPNRSALANLDENLRVLVSQLRVSGMARKQVAETTSAPSSSRRSDALGGSAAAAPAAAAAVSGSTPEAAAPLPSLQELLNKKTGYEAEAEEGDRLNSDELAAELDDLDFGDNNSGHHDGDDDGSLDDDDDLDLR